MKTQIKIGIGVFRESIQWVFRFLIIAAIIFLVVKIYKINPFFVQISSLGLALIAVLIPDVYILLSDDYLYSKRVFGFGLILFKEKYKLSDIKEIVVYGHFKEANRFSDYLFPHINHKYYNQLRLIMKNGDVKTIHTSIYISELEEFGKVLSKAIENKNTPLSFNHPNYKEL